VDWSLRGRGKGARKGEREPEGEVEEQEPALAASF